MNNASASHGVLLAAALLSIARDGAGRDSFATDYNLPTVVKCDCLFKLNRVRGSSSKACWEVICSGKSSVPPLISKLERVFDELS